MRQAAIAFIVEVARLARRAVIPSLVSRVCCRRVSLPSPVVAAFALVLCSLAVALPAPALATIRYEVSVAHPGQHRFHVAMVIPGVHGNILVQMPAWNALYQIRDFAFRVSDFRATDASGNAVPVERIDKATWRVEGPGEIHVDYSSFWDDPGPFDTQLDDEHAFINLAMVLCYVPERRAEDAVVQFKDVPPEWKIAVELPAAGTAAAESASYRAASYDALVDAPVEIGRFEQWTFQVKAQGAGQTASKTIRVVLHGEPQDHAAVTRMLSDIVNYETRLMGDAPFPEYTFFLHIGQDYGGGGMEHANSTAISVASLAALPNVGAHEFFHLWNVKRIRPQSLEPVDYTREMFTPSLWFAEGVTSTYASYTLVRSGVWTRAQFLADLGRQITELQARPARIWQSAEESSLDTWFDRYPLYDRPDFSISYYNKGQLLGVALDILIRDSTDNRASLDDVLRRLNQQYAQRGRYYADSAGIQAMAEQAVRFAKPDAARAAVAGAPIELGEFFKRYVSGTDEMPFADLLSRAGLALKAQGEKRAALGFAVERDSAGLTVVSRLDASSAAGRAGLRNGDLLLSIAGGEVPRDLDAWVRGRPSGEMLRFRIRRGGREREISFPLGQEGAQANIVEEMAQPSDRQIRIRNGLFQGTTEPPTTAK
jgi:predicted metalloprotease with PDZ domain